MSRWRCLGPTHKAPRRTIALDKPVARASGRLLVTRPANGGPTICHSLALKIRNCTEEQKKGGRQWTPNPAPFYNRMNSVSQHHGDFCPGKEGLSFPLPNVLMDTALHLFGPNRHHDDPVSS